MCGTGSGGTRTKLNGLVPIPNGETTRIGPVAASVSTTATRAVSERIEKFAWLAGPNATAVASDRCWPRISTGNPTLELSGTAAVMTGAGPTVNTAVVVTEPEAVVTVIGPVSASGGTIATIWVAATLCTTAGCPAKK